jgi:phage tail P2-like protein
LTELTNVSLAEILPSSIKHDEKIQALTAALDLELQKLSAVIEKVLHLPNLDKLPHEVLDKLAEQFSAIFYEPEEMSLSKKRKIVATSLLQWRKIGTAYAVKQMLLTFSSDATISEWFEYDGGKPYHFKLKLKHLQDLADDGETIMRLINTVKNARSWLDDLEFNLSTGGTDEVLHAGHFQISQGEIFSDIDTTFNDNHKISIVQSEVVSGEISHDLSLSTGDNSLKLRAGIAEIISGEIQHGCDFQIEDNETWYKIWLAWIRTRWKNFDKAIIDYYRDAPDDEEDDFDEKTFEGNFLKLWFSYHNDDKIRLIVMPFPRSDLTAHDINAVNVDGIFINRRGALSDKIIRAVYVDKKVVKLNF